MRINLSINEWNIAADYQTTLIYIIINDVWSSAAISPGLSVPTLSECKPIYILVIIS